ncbi:hypothetical protein B0H14DRAFT_3625040 [Mycena olivaceomarginata]|nr:hypothetical protein B0H14DRAFT_3625040 [Mycena olivaceomarginata]
MGSRVMSARCEHLTIPVFGKDVFYDCPNEIFMQQKQFVKFRLTTENFHQYVGMIEDKVDEFIEKNARFRTYQQNDINEWGNFDAIAAMAEITILAALHTLQGKKVCEGLNKSFSQLYTDLDGGFTPLNFLFANLPLKSYCNDVLYTEQVKRFANPDGSLCLMSYENLRHLPVLDLSARTCLPTFAAPNKDGGIYVMPKDTYVLASPLISQINTRIWKDGAA